MLANSSFFFLFSHNKMAEMSETLTLPLEFKHIAEFKTVKTSNKRCFVNHRYTSFNSLKRLFNN